MARVVVLAATREPTKLLRQELWLPQVEQDAACGLLGEASSPGG